MPRRSCSRVRSYYPCPWMQSGNTYFSPELLEAVLLANMRFHDVTSRGVILNRFGKDFEGWDIFKSYGSILTDFLAVDNDLPNELGSTLVVGLQSVVTILSITYVSGWPFALASLVMITLGLYSKLLKCLCLLYCLVIPYSEQPQRSVVEHYSAIFPTLNIR